MFLGLNICGSGVETLQTSWVLSPDFWRSYSQFAWASFSQYLYVKKALWEWLRSIWWKRFMKKAN